MPKTKIREYSNAYFNFGSIGLSCEIRVVMLLLLF